MLFLTHNLSVISIVHSDSMLQNQGFKEVRDNGYLTFSLCLPTIVCNLFTRHIPSICI